MLEIAVLRPRREARRCSGRAGTSESYEQARGAAVPGLREGRQGGGARDGDQGERRDACHGEAGRAGGARVVPASCVAPGRRRRRGLARERSAASTNERVGQVNERRLSQYVSCTTFVVSDVGTYRSARSRRIF